MTKVGTAELKNRLSHYLREVRQGQTILVMDRNEPVARLEPIEKPDVPQSEHEVLMQMVREGIISNYPPKGKLVRSHKKVRLKGGVSGSDLFIKWKDEDRY